MKNTINNIMKPFMNIIVAVPTWTWFVKFAKIKLNTN